jgi:hypothetical protein
MKWWQRGATAAAVAAGVIWACGGPGGSGGVAPILDSGIPDAGQPDAGQPDAGQPDAGQPDAGQPDAGNPDGGQPDAGQPDGGSDGGQGWTPPPAIAFPSVATWTFYGPQHGGPHDVYQVSADQGGNIWVAGGEDGLFLLRPGATNFERFTMADGLRPYGYLPDGSDPVGPKFLKVIAVTGGPAGTVFVGYEGRPGCEINWDSRDPAAVDASIYKSGDADRVTIDATGKLSVVHYDIFSGPNVVSNEKRGREKLCTIYRIVWNPDSNDLWFGGNHGFAWGDPNYAGDPTCNGQWACSGVLEHSHPAINGAIAGQYLTSNYRGIAVDPVTKDVWFGGEIRTTRFHWNAVSGSPRQKFYDGTSGAAWLTEGYNDMINPPPCPSLAATPCYINNRIDVWRDAKGEGSYPGLSDRTDDVVFGIAAAGDGSVYVGSGWLGLRRLDAFGNLMSDETARLTTAFVGAVARDPSDGSIWVGNRYAGGVHRLRGTATDHYALNVFGSLANSGVEDVQFAGTGAGRRVLVGFRQTSGTPGFVAVYSGN